MRVRFFLSAKPIIKDSGQPVQNLERILYCIKILILDFPTVHVRKQQKDILRHAQVVYPYHTLPESNYLPPYSRQLKNESNKESACNAGEIGWIPGSGRSPGEGNGNPLQYSYLENPMDRRAWWATVHGVAKHLDVTENEKEIKIVKFMV